MNFFSLHDIIGVKCPPLIPSLVKGSRLVTVPFQEYNLLVQLCMGQRVQVTYNHVIIELEPWAEGVSEIISVPFGIFEH